MGDSGRRFLSAVWVAFLSLSTFAAVPPVVPGFPVITNYGAPEIPTRPYAYAMKQAPDGRLIVGGYDVMTFDGVTWSNHPMDGVLGVMDIDFDQTGRMWIAAEGDVGWVETPVGQPWRFHSLRPHLRPDEAIQGLVVTMEAAAQGRVAFLTLTRIYLWDGKNMRSWPFELGHHRLYTLDGEFYVHDLKVGLFHLTGEGLRPASLSRFEVNAPEDVRWIHSDGLASVVTQNGRLIVNVGGQRRELPAETSALLLERGAATSFAGPDGRIALFTYPPLGLAVVGSDDRLEQIITEDEGLAKLRAVFGDPNGFIWIAAETGLQRIQVDPRTRLYDERAGLPATPYQEIAATREAVAAGISSLLFVGDASGRSFRRIDDPPRQRSVAAVEADGDSFLVSRGGELLRVNPLGEMKVIATPGAAAEAVQRSRIKPEQILLGLYDLTIVAHSESRGLETIVKDVPVVAASLAEDSDGRLWIGTDSQGIFVAAAPQGANPAIPTRPDPESGLPEITGQVYVRASAAGDIVVVADKGGWAKAAGEARFRPILNYPDRPLATCADFVPDGSLWIVHDVTPELPATVARISRGPAGWSWSPHAIPDLGVIGPPCALAAVEADPGRIVLWVAGSRSILRHEVTAGPQAPTPASPRLRGHARLADGAVALLPAALPFATEALAFEYSPAHFGGGSELRFETLVEGVDRDWQPPTRDGRRELSGLRDGRYLFKVRAVVETGMRSEPTVLAFEVLPPWWRTKTALWLEAAGLLVVVLAGLQWRTRALRERARVLEQKVQVRTEELVAANAAKTQFVANMSHDIRNPLNGIVGITLALDETPLDGQQRELVSTLRECTTYLSSLVDDVLDFASIEAGKVELRTAPFAPNDLLNSVVSTLRAQTAEASAAVVIEADPELPPLLQGDAGRIQQILVNFVSNALKYAPGHIRLAAALPSGAPGEIEFSVADEGPGLDPAEQAALFTKFSRLKSARERHIPGTGLGLASCRLLADAMGGSVGVDSVPGRGSRFFLRLPLNPFTEIAPIADGLEFAPTTILLVEDTDYNALAARAVLRRLGLTCDRAATGEEAIRMFAEKRHAIVLLDRNLPDLDGTEVARRIRELETDGLRALLLAVTAYATAEDRQLCIDAGMDAFVGKPLTPEKLRKALLSGAGPLAAPGAHADAPLASAPAVPPLDFSILNYLAEGTPGGLAAQAERFIGELRQAHQAVQSAAGTVDLVLADAAHRLLGSARMISAQRLTTLCSELEDAARRREEPAVRSLLPQVAAEVDHLTAAMRRHSGVAPV